MIGDWIIYNDQTIDNPGTNKIWLKTEYVTAYNIVTHETRVLGSSSAYATVDWYNSMTNMNRVYYSQNGLKWITSRNTAVLSGDNYVNWVRGSIALDTEGDPASCSISIGSDDFTMGGFYYGYKDNVEVAEWNYHGGVDNYIRITHMDADKDFALGYHMQYRVGCWDLTDPRTERYAATHVILRMGDRYWKYAIDQTTGIPDISSKPADYHSWESLVLGLEIDSTETYGSPYSAVMSDIGAFISIGRYGFFDGNCFTRQHYHINVFIDIDGNVTDLGYELLDNSTNGPLLSVAPLIISH